MPDEPGGPTRVHADLLLFAADLAGARDAGEDWAVISLCRTPLEFSMRAIRRQVYLVDQEGPAHNADLRAVVADVTATIDRFLEDATEVDVDALRDARGNFAVGGIMEHVEEAGVHSGDSACVLPPVTLSAETRATIAEYTHRLAEELGVVGLINVQYAVKDGEAYVIEANPRASRTVPFVAKATGVPLAKVATRVMLGATLAELRQEALLRPPVSGGHVSVKEAVLPFKKFMGVDARLGPEMRSTGEVMGLDHNFNLAFAKSQMAAGFLRALDVAILSNHRRLAPRGLAGGGDGACGRTTLLRAGGQAEVLGSADSGRVFAGDAVEVETPGGGGWGTPPA